MLTLQVDNPEGDSHIVQDTYSIESRVDVEHGFDSEELQNAIMFLLERLDERMKA